MDSDITDLRKKYKTTKLSDDYIDKNNSAKHLSPLIIMLAELYLSKQNKINYSKTPKDIYT